MSESIYEYLKKRCDMLEQKVQWFESQMAQVSFRAAVRRDELSRNDASKLLDFYKHRTLDGLARTIADSKHIIYTENEDYLGKTLEATTFIFTGYKQKLFGEGV